MQDIETTEREIDKRNGIKCLDSIYRTVISLREEQGAVWGGVIGLRRR